MHIHVCIHTLTHAWPDPAEDVKKPVKKGSKKKQVAPPLTEALTCLPTVHGCTQPRTRTQGYGTCMNDGPDTCWIQVVGTCTIVV